MEYHSPRKDPDVESGHHKVRKGLFVLFVATNMGAPCAYKPPRSNLIDVGDSQPNEEEQHAEPLIENNVNFFPLFFSIVLQDVNCVHVLNS
jgi:hypothetical protein